MKLPPKERFMLDLAKAIHQMDLNRILTMKHISGFKQEETVGEIAETIMGLGASLYESVQNYHEKTSRFATCTGMFEVALCDLHTDEPYVEVSFKPEEEIYYLHSGKRII
jgi:hypothetical protein